MSGQIIYLSKAWLQKTGDLEAHVTPVGGLMFIHDRMKIPATRLVYFANVFPKHLTEDLESDCTLFYLNERGEEIGNIDFRNWLFEPTGVRRAATFARMGNKKSITFSPKHGQGVPRQAVALAFRFETEFNGVRSVKYFLEVPIVRDMRKVLPPPADRRFVGR